MNAPPGASSPADAAAPPPPRRPRRALRTLAWTVATLAAALAALDVYTHLPSEVEPAPLTFAPQTRELIVVIHGSFGADEPTVRDLHARFVALAAGRPGLEVVRYVWAPHANTFLRAASRGTRVGQRLGERLGASSPALARVHLVAHSAGAYLLDPLCEGLRAARSTGAQAPEIAMTFLDPIGIHGIWETSWGASNLGRCADFAEAFLNLDDAVRATNELLTRAWNVDVTRAPGRGAFSGSGHVWPVKYYAEALSPADLFPTPADQSLRPRGGVERR